MPDWMLPKVIDYWDHRVDAVDRLSRLLDEAPEGTWESQVQQIKESIERHLDALSDNDLATAGYIACEDLYKTVAHLGYWSRVVGAYLVATGEPFFEGLKRRGFVVNYFINNTWDNIAMPARWFGTFFRAARLNYLCPQEIACRFVEKDRPEEEWPALAVKHLKAGRDATWSFYEESVAEDTHLVYLDCDPNMELEDLPPGFNENSRPGRIFMYRSDAPEPGSKCVIRVTPKTSATTAKT